MTRKRNPIIEKIGPIDDDEACRLVHACRMVDRLEKAVAVEFETDGPDEKRAQELADAKAAIIAALVSGEMP